MSVVEETHVEISCDGCPNGSIQHAKKCVAKAFEKRKTISGSHYFTEAKGESTHDDGIDHD